MDRFLSPSDPHSILVLVTISAGALAVLLFLLGGRRRAGWIARVLGPGAAGSVVYREADVADPRAPAFLVELEGSRERREVLPRGAFLISPRLGPHRGELRVGDPLLVTGVGLIVPRSENLYRETGCQLVLDALTLVRLAPRRTALLRRGAGACFCLAALAAGGVILSAAAEHAFEAGYLPPSILRAGRALTAAGLVCPRGAELRTEERDSTLPGFLHRCRKGDLDHGPFAERDLTGLLRRAGSYHLGRRTGRWFEQLPLDAPDLLLRIQSYSDDQLDGPFMMQTRYNWQQTGGYRAGVKSGWWEERHRDELHTAGNYVEGVKDGWWWEEGNHGSYRHGKRQGEWLLADRTFAFLLLGAVTTYGHMVDGQLQGPARLHFADGRFAVGGFRDDLPDGRWTIWSNDGRKLLSGEYRSGLKGSQWIPDPEAGDKLTSR